MRRSVRNALVVGGAALALAGCAGNGAKTGDASDVRVEDARFAPVYQYLQDADWLRAEAELQRLAKGAPDDPRVHANLGIVYGQTDRFAEAVASLEAATRLAPRSPEAFNELGIAYRKNGAFADAAQAYRTALELDPDHAKAHFNLGVLLDLYLRQPSAALTHYERYLALAGDEDKQVKAWVSDLRRRASAGAAAVAGEEEAGRQ